MSNQFIISVGREFGSGGHEIAQKLADHYGIQLLDHNLLNEIAQDRHLSVKDLESFDEKRKNPLISRTVRGFSSSPEENVFHLQFEYMQKKANEGQSFVVVGRCSEDVLKNYDAMISIFILGDTEAKCKRVEDIYKLSHKEADKFMREKDMKRKRYHNHFCAGKWGDSRCYDYSINSSKLGLDGTVEELIHYIDHRREIRN